MPVCPQHHSEMKLGKGGGYFCPRKMDDGSWCPERVAAPKSVSAAPANGVAPTPKQLLIIAALDFASRVYQGSGDASGAIDLANQTLIQFGGAK